MCVELEWSKKMYQCAGICYLKKSAAFMACTIRLSEPLLKLRSRKELVETLLHEMIHAWNFINGIQEENGGHGQKFLAKMHEINKKTGTNITVYHTFHDEVELYKKHWWRCEGACRERKPFYGYVKRVANRAPGPNDLWWKSHQSTCGGNFIKIKEPEKVEKKKKTTKKPAADKGKKPVADKGKNNDIRKYFPNSSQSDFDDDHENTPTDDFGNVLKKPRTSGGEGNVLGGSGSGTSKLFDIPTTSSAGGSGYKIGGAGNGRSRLLDMFEEKKKKMPDQEHPKKKIKLDADTVVIDDSPKFVPVRKSIQQKILDEFEDEDVILIDDEFDDSLGNYSETVDKPNDNKTCECPICNEAINVEDINRHLDECLTMQMIN